MKIERKNTPQSIMHINKVSSKQ